MKALLGLTAFKVLYFGLLVSALLFFGSSSYNGETAGNVAEEWFSGDARQWLLLQNSSFYRHFATWDAQHYLVLSKFGYSKGLSSSAFYPLWPFLIGITSSATGARNVMVSLILSNFLSLIACTLFYESVKRRMGNKIALWAVVALVVFPGSLFLQMGYSESAFLLLLVLVWMSFDGNRKWIGILAAWLLPLTRAVGVFVVLPAIISAAAQFRRSRLRLASEVSWSIVISVAIFAGWFAYLGIMHILTGDAFTGIYAQKAWGAHSISNLWNAEKFVLAFSNVSTWHEFKGSFLDRATFILVIALVPLVWRIDRQLVAWMVALAMLPAMSGGFVSFTRFAGVCFPLFIALGSIFARSRTKAVPVLFCLLFMVIHVWLLWRFVNFNWAG